MDARPDVLGVLGGEVDRDADLARVQVSFVCKCRDALFVAAFEVTQAGDDFPDVWPGGQRSPAVMSWTAEDDAGMVQCLDALDDEAFEQRCCADALAFGASCQAVSSLLTDPK